jgi:hypothetical protein
LSPSPFDVSGTDNDHLPTVQQLRELKNELSNRSFSEKREAQLRWTKVNGSYEFTGDACSADKCGNEDEEEEEDEERKVDGALKEKDLNDGQIEVDWRSDRRKKSETDRKERKVEAVEVEDVQVLDDSDSSCKEEEPQNTSTRPPPRVRHSTLPKPVEQLDLVTGVVLRRYESQKHATRIMKLNCGMIAKCFADPTLTAGNFRWRESRIPSSKSKFVISMFSNRIDLL